MMLLPSLSHATILDFDWEELRDWHTRAVMTHRKIQGINHGGS